MAETKSVLKGAHYFEEREGGESHAFSVFIPLEEQNGFVLGVLSSRGIKASFDVLSGIIQQHLERLSTSIDAATNLTHRFEQLLQALNEDVSRAAEDGSFALPIADTSSVIGVANNQTVVVSGFGNLLAQFMHKSDKEQFDIYDLSKGMRVEEEAPSWKKSFLTVLDGEMRSGDVLYVGTRVSRHDLPAATLNEIITTLPPNSAVSKIRQYLPLQTVFASVIVKNDALEEPHLISEKTAQVSLKNLDTTISQTDRYLSEQKPEVRSLAMKVWLIFFPKRGSAERRKMIKHIGRFGWRLLLVFFTVAGRILLGVCLAVAQGVKRTLRNPKQTLAVMRSATQQTKKQTWRLYQRFNELPKTSKVILLGLVTLGVLLSGGLVVLHREQQGAAERQAYAASLNAAQKKLENAEASLIYGDEQQARVLLNDAWQLASALSTTTAERKQTAESLLAQIQTKRDSLRHAVTPELTTVVDASGLNAETLAFVVPFDGKWYGLTDQANVYTLDPVSQSLVKLDVTKGDVGTPQAVSPGETAIYWLDAAGLARYAPDTGDSTPLSVSRQGVDLQYYGGKMYILSPETGQVYKHQRTTTGFDGGAAWVISGVSSLADARALTIDGYLYVLKSDGSILRYSSGKETDWKVDAIEPTLLNAIDIWTDEHSPYLYVLDAAGKRVVVFDKDKGTLVVQYENEAFSDLKSMIVDEVNKNISVLAGSKVYQFAVKQ